MIRLLATGDVGANRADLASMFSGCRDALGQGDIVFGQLETTVTDRGARSPNAKLAMRAPPEMAGAVRNAGYHAMSFAGNHCLDWGYEGFLDTFRHMEAAGVSLCGAGHDLREASRPLTMQADGIRVAIFACSSILPEGYGATDNRPGCMPLRAHTLYQPVEPDQPGTPARIVSYPHRGDLDALLSGIKEIRGAADVILVSIHWGLHMVEAEIADYQRIIAHAVIDAGAHAILGHHPHILKGIELYRDAPVFYSLGNFALEQPHIWDAAITQTESFRHLASLNPGWDSKRTYMLPENTRMTGIAALHLSKRGLERTEFLPAWIGDDSSPEMLAPSNKWFARTREYLQQISTDAGLKTRFETETSGLLIAAA